MLNYNRSTLIQSGLRVIGMLLIWMMFTNISLKMFFINPRLLHLTLIGLVFAILLNEISRPQIDHRGGCRCRVRYFAGIPLPGYANCQCLADSGGLCSGKSVANIQLIDEPHCRWIIFGFISGTGLVLLFTTSYHHYFSLVSLMYITLMVFANIFFSYYAFMKKNNQLSMIIISVLILMLCLTLSISFLKIILITVILAFYVYFESRVNFRNHEKRANVSAISFLLFSFLICF